MTLEEAISKDLDYCLKIWRESIFELGYQTAKREIIHCKDCKYWQDNNGCHQHESCKWVHIETPDEDDFCSCGERIDE